MPSFISDAIAAEVRPGLPIASPGEEGSEHACYEVFTNPADAMIVPSFSQLGGSDHRSPAGEAGGAVDFGAR